MSNMKKILKRSVAMLLSAAMISAGGAPFTIMDALVSYATELVPEKNKDIFEASDSNADDKNDPVTGTDNEIEENNGKTEEDDFDKDYMIKKVEPLKSSLKSQTMTEDEDIYEAISFPEFLTVTTMSGEELELEVDWYLRDEDTEIKAGSIIYFDAELPVGYELKAGVKLPSIRVSVKAEADDGMTSEATPSQVTNATPSELMKMNLLSDDGVYEVGTAEEYEKALEDIKTNETLGSEIMIVLTSDLSYKNDPYRTYPEQPLGLEGYTLTYKSDVSEGEEPYIIFQSGYYSIGAVGDVILDNVGLCADQTVNHNLTTVSSFYANGHTVEFSENFAEPIKNLYGGSSGKNVSSTHLIINGDIYKGSPSGDHMVFGGGAFKNGASKTSNGHVKGDVLIEIGPHSHASWIHGGGENSQVEGDVTIIMNGDPDDPNHQIGNITGGGVSDKDKDALSSLKGLRAGTVSGDINLYLYSGKTSGIEYGGGHNNSGVLVDDFVDKYDYGKRDSLYYATVGGDVNVTVGGGEYELFTNTTSNYNIFGSCYSVILGNLNVTINDGTDFEEKASQVSGIYLMGRNDTVKGAVKLTVNGGKVGDIYGLGEAWVTSLGTHVIGEYDYNDYEPDIDKLTIEVNDGEVGQITWFYSLWKQTGTWKYKDPKIYGNVKININGGKVSRVYICTPTAKGVSDLQGLSSNSYKNLPYVYGAKGIELHITGGTFSAVPSVYGLKTARVYNGQTVFFENDEEVQIWALDHVEKIIVDNSALASVKYYKYDSGDEYPSLINCGTLEIMPEGMIGLGGENTLNGDNGQVDEALIVHEGGILCLPTAQDGRPNGVLNVNGDGIANSDPDTISGFLRTVEAVTNDNLIRATATPLLPKEGEVYLRSKSTNETAPAESDANLLDLENTGDSGLYVEYTKQDEALTASDGTKYTHAWRIAQGEKPEIKKYHVIYDFISGTRGASLPDVITNLEPVDSNTYAMGETVTAILPETTRVEWYNNEGSSNPKWGVWTFKEYDADSKVVSEDTLEPGMGSDDSLYIAFEGKWIWSELKYPVKYTFVSDDGTALPKDVTDLLPEDTTTYGIGKTVTAIEPEKTTVEVSDGKWTFTGYKDNSIEVSKDILNEDGEIEFVGTWKFEKNPEPPVKHELTLSIQDMTAYTGGSSLNEDSFPAPRFKAALETRAALPEGGITLKVDGEEAGTIDGLSEVFLILGLSAEHTLEDADAPSEDDGTAGVYTISISDEAADKVTASDKDRNEYTIHFTDGELIVRHVSDPEGTLDEGFDIAEEIKRATPSEAPERPVAIIPAGSTFKTNNKEELLVLDDNADGTLDSMISLMSDELLSQFGEDRRTDLIDRAEAVIFGGAYDEDRNYEFKYLDLINETDGNAWVSSSLGSDIIWPYPDETDEETDFKVIHFADLHREYGFKDQAEVEDAIKACVPEEMEIEKTDIGIKFHVPESGFSPFAVTWIEGSDEPGGGTGGGGGEDPDPDVPGEEEKPDPDVPGGDEKPEDPDKPGEEEKPDDKPEDKPHNPGGSGGGGTGGTGGSGGGGGGGSSSGRPGYIFGGTAPAPSDDEETAEAEDDTPGYIPPHPEYNTLPVMGSEILGPGYVGDDKLTEANGSFSKIEAKSNSAAEGAAVKSDTGASANAAERSIIPELSGLYAQNNDLLGWLTVPGTGNGYPVMNDPDVPTYYWHHTFDRQYSDVGVPFTAPFCTPDSDNILIHGHNMNGTLQFGNIWNYQYPSFRSKHPVIDFKTIYDSNSQYEVMAIFFAPVYAAEQTGVFKWYQYAGDMNRNQFEYYVQNVKALSLYDTGVTAEYGDKLITLETCANSHDSTRLVVVARKKAV